MSDSNTLRYKQITRQARIQTREGEFSGGMFFTDKPQTTGYSKLLVNYDINPTDGTLRTRRGFQSKAGITEYSPISKDWLNITGAPLIADSCIQNTPSWFTEEMPTLNMIVCEPESKSVYFVQSPLLQLDSFRTTTSIAGTDTNRNGSKTFYDAVMVKTPLSTGLASARNGMQDDTYQINLKHIERPVIHGHWCNLGLGMGMSGTGTGANGTLTDYFFSKPIGTFAFNNAYYFFSKYNTEHPKLHYIRSGAPSESTTGLEHVIHTPADIADTPALLEFIIEPTTQTPSEAASSGYNMLLDNPYAFTCITGANINILGILPYDTADTLILTPVVNKEMTLKCFYRAPSASKEYRVIWEWREVGATTWNTIKDEKINFSTLALAPLTCNFSSAVEQLILRVTISDPSNKVTQSDGTEIEFVESTTAIGLNFVINISSSRQQVTPTKYDLGTAKGMLEWNRRLVLWGVENADTMLFTSDVNNPTFFPYPNNVDVFNEPILHCMLYGNDLLVFTATSLYRLVFDETGITWTHTLIQKDLQISPQDIPMFCRVKNLIFFKSGNYYYMLVPKSSSIVGDTTIAPISNNIKDFLDHFPTEVSKIFKTVSLDLKGYNKKTWTITDFLCYYYSYVDNASVVLNFVYSLDNYAYAGGPGFHNVSQRYWVCALIYDTENYSWRIHTYVTPKPLTPVQIDVTQQTVFGSIVQYTKSNDTKHPCVVLSVRDPATSQDNFITWKDEHTTDSEGTFYDYQTTWAESISKLELKNYQYLDTGYRMLTSSVDLKKRFREVQFSINNISQKALTFYTSFILDGQLRRDMQGYNTKVILDPTDPRTGILLVERPYIDPKFLPSVPEFTVSIKDYINPDVTPGDTTLDDSFVLDNTKFPDLAYWKVRVSVSGKGYTPRLQVLSTNDLDYNILSTNWVYRTMNSR